ncbi:MAG: AAA family ATPase [Candidatus Limnocylindria bacterium]
MAQQLVGRGDEALVRRRFLDAAALGPSCLIWEGEPGIGKTALWQATVDEARAAGVHVLSSRPTESEAELSYASLTDLVGSVDDDIRAALAPPQRRALDAALLQADVDADGVDVRALAMATRLVLVALAGSGPVILAIDDLQWIDPATARVLAFVTKRLDREPVSLVVARRSGGALHDARTVIERSMPEASTEVCHLGPLSLGALHQLVEQRMDVSLARPALVHLERASRGNPLLALDIVGALRRAQRPLTADMILPVPSSVDQLVRQRVAMLPASTRRLLRIASALARADVPTLESAEPGIDLDAVLRPAIEAELIDIEGLRVRFVHPLYRSAVYASQSDGARRALHHRLASAVGDQEEAAFHTALGATAPDAAAAGRVSSVADAVFRRGALDAAAALFEHALRLTPPGDVEARAAIMVSLARIFWDLGDLDASRSAVDDVLGLDVQGPLRTGALLLRGTHVLWREGAEHAIPIYNSALATATGSPEMEATVHLRIAYAADHDLPLAESNARAAVDLLEGIGDCDELRAAAWLLAAELGYLTGRPYDDAAVARARSLLERPAAPERAGASIDARAIARERSWILRAATDDIAGARVELEAIRRADAERGRDRGMPILLADLVELCSWMGDLPAARAFAAEAAQLLAQTGRAPYAESATAMAASLVAEHAGDVALASELAARALDLALPLGPGPMTDRIHIAIGRLALAADRPREAVAAFTGVDERLDSCGANQPLVYRYKGDHIEALVLAGDEVAAEQQLARLAAGVARAPTPWGLSVVARSRALLAASAGNLALAEAELDTALQHHRDLPMPIELGRTLLHLGRVRRRRRQKRVAGEALERSRAVFAAAGAAGWEGAARRELDRIGHRSASADELSPTELGVARLAARGMTNRQVADAMVLSPKTIDGVLARVYAKLGIHSRAELGARIGQGSDPHSEG